MDYAILILSIVGIALFLWLFTGELNATNGRTKLLWMARFSYLFALAVMTLILASFKYPQMFAPEPHQSTANPAFSVVPACVQPPDQDSVPAGIDCGKAAYQWVINIGGIHLTKEASDNQTTESATKGGYAAPSDVVHLQGGLVVPLYVIIVALMGGTVSMTRRVPEIQKQAWRYIEMTGFKQNAEPTAANDGDAECAKQDEFGDSKYHQADGDDINSRRPITMDFARERLIFQVMQVVSAPIVAMIAYYLFEPDSKAMSIGIAFISGFASESVLIGIRRLGDGVLNKVSGGGNPAGSAPTAGASS